MADITSTTKAQLLGIALKSVFGEEPSYYYAPDYVRVYFEPDRLKRVQRKIQQMAVTGPSDVRVDWLPMITPLALNQALPYAIGLLVVGIFIGSQVRK